MKCNEHRAYKREVWDLSGDSGGFHGGSNCKESACNAGNPGMIPEAGRSPGEGNGYPVQYSCLGNSTNREAWRAIYSPWGCNESTQTE